jgi:dipeptidase
MKIMFHHFILFISLIATEGCTTVLVGRNATLDGSMLVSYGSDAHGTPDSRLVLIPSTTHKSGETRKIWEDIEDYPRYVGKERSPVYAPKPGQNISKPIGEIPEIVGATNSYYETSYGVVNSLGVAIGESSCSARLFGSPERGAIMSIDELSRIALERASTAKEAVQIMGDLAVKYGFYGVTRWSKKNPPHPVPLGGSNEGGEVLTVSDGIDGWVFHILSDGGKSAVWAARRVPDDEATSCSNMFTLRVVNLNDQEHDEWMWSENMLDVAQTNGWWNTTGKEEAFDFAAIFSSGEYHNKYYSGRRMWRVLSMLAPSMKLNPVYSSTNLLETQVYPWSVKPDQLVQVEDLTTIMRDVYENTSYDVTTAPGGGPWGTPARMDPWLSPTISGSWERTISVFRTTFSYVVQLRPFLPGPLKAVVWYAPHSAIGSVYVPLYCGAGGGDDYLPEQYSVGNPSELNKDSAWWAHRYVTNIAYSRWNVMSNDVKAEQIIWEERGLALQAQLDADYVAKKINETELYFKVREFATSMLDSWWKMPDKLIFKYADGYINTKDNFGQIDEHLYPDWWLKEVGYESGPGFGPEEGFNKL